jgi:hypothetical protein
MYSTPTSLNNLLAAQYDLTQLARDIRDVTGNETAYNIFIRSLPVVLKDPLGLAKLLLSAVPPVGFLQTIALETSDFSAFQKISILGSDLPNEMNDIRGDIRPYVSVVTEQVYNPSINTDIQIWVDDTRERRERNENRITIINTFRMAGLTGMYEQAARDTYTTTEDIEHRKNILDAYYEQLIENDNTMFVINDVKNELDILKTRTEQVLETKAQSSNVFGVVIIKLERAYSAKMIAYELYGEYIKNEIQLNTYANILTSLNRDQPAHRLIGNIKVLEVR